MATEKWVGGSGQGLTWGSAFSTEINSVTNGNAILSTVSITNGTALDIFCDVDFIAGATITVAAPAYLGLYLYPLLDNGTTYGDGEFSTSAAGPPPSTYSVGTMGFVTGTVTLYGMVRGIILPPGTFSFVLYNQSGATLASSNTCKYRTYNRSIA